MCEKTTLETRRAQVGVGAELPTRESAPKALSFALLSFICFFYSEVRVSLNVSSTRPRILSVQHHPQEQHGSGHIFVEQKKEPGVLCTCGSVPTYRFLSVLCKCRQQRVGASSRVDITHFASCAPCTLPPGGALQMQTN